MILLLLTLALAQPPHDDPPPLVTPPTPPAANPPAAKQPRLPSGKYAVLKISGDLDTDFYLRAICSELDRLHDNSLLILELDGDRARPDLVARLGARIANSSPPVAVLLKDTRDKHVGVGQAFLGGFVKACYMDPGTRITSAADDDLSYLAPSDTNWESTEQSMTGPLWRHLTQQHADQSLPPLLLHPRDVWAIPSSPGEPWKLSQAAPAGGQSGPQPRQVSWTEGSRIDIDAETAVALRLCAGAAQSLTPLLTDSNLSPRSTGTRHAIESKFADTAATVSRILDDAKLSLRKISNTLAVKSPDRTTTADDYRRAGQSALTQVDTLARELDRADSLLAEYPELSRRRPSEKPSRTDKGPFRPTLDGLRKDLDKLRTTARDFASR